MKRKVNQCENHSKLATTFGLMSREKYDKKKVKYPLSDSPFSKDKQDSLHQIEEDVDLPAQNDREKYCSVSMQDYSLLSVKEEYCSLNRQDYSHLTDTEESVKGPCQLNIVAGASCTFSTNSSIKKETNIEFSDVLKPSINEDFDLSNEVSHSLNLEKEEMQFRKPLKKYLPSRLSHFRRFPIPIGPRFQAEIPKWEGTKSTRHYHCDYLKWLGTLIWSQSDISETNLGNGRSESCACDVPGSIDCVQQHVRKARELLQSQIGTTFSSWKFDEMGEDVSKSWTLKEQKKFEYLARLNLKREDTNFWNIVMKYFPAKSMKSMVNYYYNVYIPRRMSVETRSCMSVETRSSLDEFDSDNDQNEEGKNEEGCSTLQIGIVPICKLLRIRNHR